MKKKKSGGDEGWVQAVDEEGGTRRWLPFNQQRPHMFSYLWSGDDGTLRTEFYIAVSLPRVHKNLLNGNLFSFARKFFVPVYRSLTFYLYFVFSTPGIRDRRQRKGDILLLTLSRVKYDQKGNLFFIFRKL